MGKREGTSVSSRTTKRKSDRKASSRKRYREGKRELEKERG